MAVIKTACPREDELSRSLLEVKNEIISKFIISFIKRKIYDVSTIQSNK